MLLGKGHVRQHVGFGTVHEGSEPWRARAELVGDPAPLRACRVRIGFGERGADPGRDNAPLSLARMCQRIAHEMHPAALPGGPQHSLCGRLEAFVRVGGDQFHAA